MDPADPRHDPAVAATGHARPPDGFYSFRAAVLFLRRDHARPRPVSDLCGVQSIAAIAVTRSRTVVLAPANAIGLGGFSRPACLFAGREHGKLARRTRPAEVGCRAGGTHMKPVSSIG